MTPPWSRRRATQPASVTVVPASRGAQAAGVMGTDHGGIPFAAAVRLPAGAHQGAEVGAGGQRGKVRVLAGPGLQHTHRGAVVVT